MIPTLAIIVPCYNESEIITTSAEALSQKILQLIQNGIVSDESYILFVDDGSSDDTWSSIQSLSEKKEIKGIKLSKNFGHQNALLAGMEAHVDQYDIAITIDADLQDDINVIGEMIQLYEGGAKIVYGVRNDRKTDSFFKRITASWFYSIMELMQVKTIRNHADFRLLDNDVVQHLMQYKERNLFLRGIIPQVGFNSANVYYSRKERMAGESKYPFFKMLSFALKGITSFSSFPLRLIFYIGVLVFISALGLVIWALVTRYQGNAIPGWTSTVIPVFIFCGLQMICLGIMGEYLGKIYEEIKKRPRYIIEKEIE